VVNTSILDPARTYSVLPCHTIAGSWLSEENRFENQPHESMARYYNLIIFQPKNSGKLELGSKVGHRMELYAKFGPNLVAYILGLTWIMLRSNQWKLGKIYIVGKNICKLQPIDVLEECIKIKKKKIRFIVVVYGLLWLRFYMEIKIRDEIG